jgi:hypothetical protein
MSTVNKNFEKMMKHKDKVKSIVKIIAINEKMFDTALECITCRPDDEIDKYVEIFISHEIEHETFKVIGDKLGISTSRVRQIHLHFIRHIRTIYNELDMAVDDSNLPVRETLVFAAYRYLKERTATDLFRYLGKDECDYTFMSIQEAMQVIEESLKTRDAVFLHNSLEAFKEAGYTPRYKNLSTATK